MNSLTKRQEIFHMGLCCLSVLLLALLFVPECDDCYFTFWRFDSLKDFLLTQPSTSFGKLVGVPENGRYLGNMLGILLAKLYFTDFGFLHGLIMGGGFLLLLRQLGKIARCGGVSRMESFSLPFFLLIFAPRGIHQEVYSWGAAWVNYLLPMIGILVLFRRMLVEPEDSQRNLLYPLLIGFLCCLFLEPTTILLVCWSLLTIWFARRSALSRRQAAVFCAGSLLGAAVMFSAPGYYHGTYEGRFVSLELIFENLPVILTQTFQRPAICAALISFLFVWLLRKQASPLWKPAAAILLPVHAVLLALALKNTLQTVEYPSRIGLILSVLLALLWVVMLAAWNNRREKQLCLALICGMCLLNGPLLIVTPVMPRNFFPSYVCLIVVALTLYGCARKEGLGSLEKLRWAALVAVCALFFVYGSNAFVYETRLEQARSEVAAGADAVTLPLVPFPGWTANEYRGKGDLSYLIYDEMPWDVALDFVPWEPGCSGGDFGRSNG